MLVKKSGLRLPNTMTYMNKKYLSYQLASTEFIRAVKGEGVFSNSDHLLALREEICDGQKKWDNINDAKLKGLVRDLNATN